jgi:hypothetical protein
MRKTLFIIFWLPVFVPVFAQRNYTSTSVLSAGNWFKIAVKEAGIYKVDVAFLNNLGITNPVSSSAIRLFGNGGQMLPENNAAARPDDLLENAILISDGGDGVLNGNDYFLFYAPGPDRWIKDSANKKFVHQKNLYSNESFYFITVSGTGKRILPSVNFPSANVSINSFDERYFHELDTVNFLSSGKEWYGEEFSNSPGRVTSRNFTVNLPGIQTNQPVTVTTDVIGRSIGAFSRFDVRLNNALLYQHNIPPLTGGSFDAVAVPSAQAFETVLTQPALSLDLVFSPGSVNGQGWLNWFEFLCKRNLSLQNTNQLLFRDWNSVAPGNVGEFIIQNATASTQVWDVTNPSDVVVMNSNITGSELRFRNDCSRLREYMAFNGNGFFTPVGKGRVNNQNLHQPQLAQMLIVTHSSLFPEALRLAQHHQQKDNIVSFIADVSQVYNEFASGTPDPTAVRDFVKMFYDRAGNDSSKRPRYLLLFGDASYDYKERIVNNTNLVPCYESLPALDPLTTYTSDDFFGLLDDNDDINSSFPAGLLDIGIGRIPAKNISEAKAAVDKIISYSSSKSFGPWRNQLTFIADDEDFNTHLNDAEIISSTAFTKAPVFNSSKIYLDAFKQESGTGGSRYPLVNAAINNRIFSGTLIWNYNGHGGFRRLAEEAILDLDMVNTWSNPDKLPLFITATCDFAPYDNPSVNSIGENILLRERTGAIAMMTTTRLVFAFSNRIINNNYLSIAMQPDANGNYLSLGEAVKRVKNFTYQTSGDVNNNRKFTLLGDPALTLAFPLYKIKTTSVNGIPVTSAPDTLKALNRYTITGTVTDLAGNTLSNFNGTAYPSIYDKAQNINTLANDQGSTVTAFRQQQNLIYNGKVKVANGNFSFTFIVPKDINYQLGNGRISYYADDGAKDGNGFTDDIIIGGIGNGVQDDKQGPHIKAFLNDEKFVNGSITNETPVLIIRLADSSGINTVGTGIGHSITAILDNNSQQVFVLNDYYEAELDSYQKGVIRFQLPKMEEGLHSLKIKAWDIFNNSNEYILEFRVVKKGELQLQHVLNYPNPFTTRTSFWFEHNRPGEDLHVTVQVMTVTGRLVKTLSKTINTTGNRSIELEWDGKDDYGDKLARGVYLYRVVVRTADGKRQEKIEKLVIL